MAMSRTFTTNLTHLLDEKGAIPDSLPKQARNLAEKLGGIVSNATIEPRLAPRSNVTCWGGTSKNKCHGDIDSSLDLESFNIFWYCLTCGDNGTISHWEDSFWDLGHR